MNPKVDELTIVARRNLGNNPDLLILPGSHHPIPWCMVNSITGTNMPDDQKIIIIVCKDRLDTTVYVDYLSIGSIFHNASSRGIVHSYPRDWEFMVKDMNYIQ
jgi:hypothetical protein